MLSVSKKSILQKILAVLARSTLRRYNPMIIGVTGSVGKTSARLAIYTVLKKKYLVRTAEKNYNNEIGLPLTILGISHYGRNVLGWLYGLIRANKRIVWRSSYPQILVLEYGVDRPGDMGYLLSVARPDVGVVTAIGEVPAHVEFFKDAEGLAAEKANMIAALPINGWAIVSRDDYAVYDMRKKTDAHILTFGTEEHAQIKIIFNDALVKHSVFNNVAPTGISFKLEYNGSVVPVRLDDVFGMPQTYAAAAAAAVGVALGMNLVEIAEALHGYIPPPGRTRLLEGKNHSRILDDTYNAAPEAMRAALETLRTLPGKRKIAVLGDMLEIGKYTEQAHRAIGDQAAEFVDVLLCVGPRAKFIADEAGQRGMPVEGIFIFDDSLSAARGLEPMIKEGDLILVKGSQAMRMERVVEKIMAEPERAGELLVRQEQYWKNG